MRIDRLVAPTVSLLAVLALLIGARTYDAWPVKPPPCSLRTLSGVPCVGCGGTRAVKALVQGEFVTAMSFNPLAILGILSVLMWFVWTVSTVKMARYQCDWVEETPDHQDRKSGWRWGIVIGTLVFLNWIYLIIYLPT